MRQLNLLTHRVAGEFIDNLNSTGALARLPDLVQGDTIDLRFIHVERDPALPAATLFRVTPWPAGIGLRVSALLIDAAPESGSFKLRVTYTDTSTEDTAAIDWNATAATFKAAVLAALKALSGIGDTEVEASDPDDTPGHFVYLTFADAAEVDSIEVIENGLAPVTIGTVVQMREAPQMQLLLKLTQAPFKLTSDFTGASVVQPVVAEAQGGGAGANEIQTITFDAATTGALQLTWDGAKTELLALPGATVQQVEDALNAIVTDGTTNPSFRVTPLRTNVLAVEFIGPLAEAAQAALGATIIATPSASELAGRITLDDPRFERVLNGEEKAEIKLEVVFTSEAGEGTILRPFYLINDGTSEATEAQLEEAGAVIVRHDTVYVDDTTVLPIATVAAGVATTPGAALSAGTPLAVTHALGTWRPQVRITRHVVNHITFASDPGDVDAATEETVPLGEGEYSWEATTENIVEITFAIALVEDTAEAWDHRLIKIDIYSPDSTVQLIDHTHEIADITDLQAALDALEASLGMLGGSLTVNVSNLVGIISASQIDIDSFITAISTAIAGNATTLATWNAMIATAVNNPAFLASFVDYFTSDPSALEAMRKLMLEVLASSTGSGALVTVSGIPVVSFVHPPKSTFVGPTITTLVSGTIEDTSQDNVKFTYTGTKEVTTNLSIDIFAPLSLAFDEGDVTAGTDASDVVLTPEDSASGEDKIRTVVGDNVYLAAHAGIDRVHCVAGDLVTWRNDHWYRVRLVGDTYYPADAESQMGPVMQSGDALTVGRRWQIAFAPIVRLDSIDRAVVGRARIVVESAPVADAGTPLFDALTWTERASFTVFPSAAPEMIRGTVKVDCTAGPVFAATATVGGVTETWTPTSGDQAIRVRVVEFDPGPAPSTDPLALYGSLVVDWQSPTHSLVSL